MKTNGKKSRQSPSVERQLALALVALLDDTSEELKHADGPAKAACEVLEANGYGKLESTYTRVARIQAQIAKAVEANDGAALAILGAALDRAKSGKPPLETEKKPRKKKAEPRTASPAEPAEKKTRKKKEDGVLCKCGNTDCDWKGTAVPGSACPVDGYLVVAQE